MPEKCSFNYALIRLVPRVEREEFINVGVILYCAARKYLQTACELDRQRLDAFAPHLDVTEIEPHLEAMRDICQGGPKAGPIGQLSLSARFHWLTAPRSTIVQTSAVHTGLCANPAGELVNLLDKMVRVPRSEPPAPCRCCHDHPAPAA